MKSIECSPVLLRASGVHVGMGQKVEGTFGLRNGSWGWLKTSILQLYIIMVYSTEA